MNFSNLFKKISQHKSDFIFSSLAFLIIIILVWYLVANLSFLVGSFNQAFNVNVKEHPNSTTFDLDTAKEVLNQ